MRLRRTLVIFVISAIASLAGAQELEQKPFVPVNRWALVVGVSQYNEKVGPLRYTAREARNFASVLQDQLGFQKENVKLLADGGTPEETPTSKNILSALDSLLSDPRLDKANLFVFYFSGHGVGTAHGDFLLPADADASNLEANAVPVKQVIERIVKAGLKNVLFIADACRAGQANDFGAQFVELCRQSNLAVILGCEPGKRSYEYPRLKSGVFTHFLVEALADRELRDESGTVWASRLGKEVQAKVREYTEPDYGTNAQKPSLWAEQSTLDVLLATYPEQPVSDLAVQTFQKSAERLDKQEFASAMMDYAAQLQLADRYDKSVEILKAVDQLGELTPAGRYLLGVSLTLLGRNGEADRTFQSFQNEPDSYYKDLSLITTRSRVMAPELRLQAAGRIMAGSGPWPEKMLAWTIVQTCGTFEQKLVFGRKFVSASSGDKRQELYASASLATVQGKWTKATQDLEAALKTPGTYPKDREVFMAMLAPIAALNDRAASQKWIDRAATIEGCEVSAHLHKAFLAKEAGDVPARIEALRQVIAHKPDAFELWEAAVVAGAQIAVLSKDFKAAADAFPYSWRARLLVSVLKQLEGDPNANQDLLLSDLYREDPLTYTSQSFELMHSLLEEGVLLGRISEMDYRRQVELYFLGLIGSAHDFGYDPDLWGQLLSYGHLNERVAQLQVVLRKEIPFDSNDAPMSLRSLLLLNAINAADDEQVKKLHSIAYDPSEGDDPQWFYAAYLASKGKQQEALKLVLTLHLPSERLLPRMQALKTYLLAAAGEAKAARARLASPGVNDLGVRAYEGLAWAALGDWTKAEPLLLEQTKGRNWAFLFASAQAMRLLDQRYRKAGALDQVQDLTFWAGVSQPSNALFSSFSFAKTPGVAQFAGSIELECSIEDDILCRKSLTEEGVKTYGFGKLRFTITPTGELSGSFDDEQKNNYPFAGHVDPLGNFRGEANLAGRHFKVAAKLAPPMVYSTYSQFKELGQLFEFVDEQGYRVAVIGRTTPLPRTAPASP